MFFKKFMPKEDRFFALFNQSAEQIVLGAHAFRVMLDDIPNSEKHAKIMKDIEHRGDEVTHNTIELLHKTFITPLDRDDIHKLIHSMDDILDFLEGASMRIWQYDVRSATPAMIELSEICILSCLCIQRSVSRLNDLTFTSAITQECVEVNRLENLADSVLRTAKAQLFKNETDARELIKLKEVYEFLETVTDRCEDVANIIQGIVLEYA